MIAQSFATAIPAADVIGERTRAACAHLCRPGQMRRSDDLRGRAQLMHAVIRSRAAFEAFHARDRMLRAALARFRERQAATPPYRTLLIAPAREGHADARSGVR